MKKIMRSLLALLMAALMLTASLVPAHAASYKTLRYGARGEETELMQTMLNAVMDADIKIDGKFGSDTLALLKQFQKAYGLTVDGVCGSKTWKKLIAAYEDLSPAASTLYLGSGKYDPDVLEEGESYSISGKITSNYKITRVTVSITPRGEDDPVIEKTAKPNSKSYNISKLDKYIKFGSLSAGRYVFSVRAADASGADTLLLETTFRVEGPDIPDSRFASTKSKVVTYSLKKDGNDYITENFRVREFRCFDGSDKILINLKLAALLQDLRDKFGPVTITSGYRTASHNKKVNGASNSQHLYGNAADIYIAGVDLWEVARYCEALGVKGIGLYEPTADSSGWIHVDVRTKKAFWLNSGNNTVSTFG